ncbi:MAG: Malonyl CoA-acyl carrier protein transacylase, partial [Verrucomicrobiales bacterium]|nr:Malonyl CoA-acyl carrier protein transacylase [Verrucomicrobiales bacterium]
MDPSVVQKDVAIVGLACRFSEREGYRSFWEHLAAGDDLIKEIPSDRWPLEGFYSEQFENPNRSSSKWGSFLRGVDEFDPRFFGISPREARSMDPQQRLLLEEAWCSIEDSGISLEELREQRTGVFVGMMSLDYAQHRLQANSAVDAFSYPGALGCILANRISYFLGLSGPSISLDTACSSSLVALHQARQALCSGEIDYAIVAGISLNLTPWKYLSFSKARMLSPDGRCKTFDQSANGYVPGEGVGVLLLQRADEATLKRN